MNTNRYSGWKINNGDLQAVDDHLTVESALTINVNGEPLTITMCTPGFDLELTRGILHSENIINSIEVLPHISITQNIETNESIAEVTVDPNLVNEDFTNSRSLLSVASCGICGKTELEDFNDAQELTVEEHVIELNSIRLAFDSMEKLQTVFSISGGSHASAAFDLNGNLLCCYEDVGRHNAVDKVIGDLILTNRYDRAKLLLVSGRVSYEIVIKCFKAKIPVLAAISAPSSLAVDFAKEFGITLLGFCRDDRATCYANPTRLSVKNDTFNDH